MSYYNKIKKLDEESLQALTEGVGPSDQCICSVLSPPEDEKSRLASVTASIKKAFTNFSGGGKKQKGGFNKNATGGGNAKKFRNMPGQGSIDIPLVYQKAGQGIFTTKEVVKRGSGSCGKCACDKNNVVLKHSYANIRITSPDVSSICPCPSDCLPNGSKLQDNITVTIEHAEFPPIASSVNQALRQPTTIEESRQPSNNEETGQLGIIYASSVTGIANSKKKTDR